MTLMFIEAPAVAPSTGGLLPLANVITEDADHIAYFGPTHETVLTGHTRTVPTDGSDKEFDQVAYLDGVRFSTYRGIDSALLLGVDGKPIAQKAFEAGESFAIETALQALWLNPKAVDLTPTAGTPVTNIYAAVGILEQWLAENYTGAPLLHSNRFAAGLAVHFRDKDGVLTSVNGTPWANGAGYTAAGPGTSTAPAGSAWVYISGQVNLWRGKLNTADAPALEQNRDLALAETAYAATVDGPTAAILVSY